MRKRIGQCVPAVPYPLMPANPRGDVTLIHAPLPPGGIELTLDVEGTTVVKSWVLAYGDQAEVLEPPALRKEMIKELRGAVARYAKRRTRR